MHLLESEGMGRERKMDAELFWHTEEGKVRNFSIKVFFFFNLLLATLTEYGNSQARGRIGATDADLHHSHSNTGSLTH